MHTFTDTDRTALQRYAAQHSLSLRWGETDQGDAWVMLGHHASVTREGGRYVVLDEQGLMVAASNTITGALNALATLAALG